MNNDSPQMSVKPVLVHREIDALLSLAYETRVNDIREAIRLAKEGQTNSHEQQYEKGIATAESHLALFKMITGKFQESRALAHQALPRFEQLKDYPGQAGVLYTIASIYYKSNDLHAGVKHMLQCRDLLIKANLPKELARCLKALGAIYEMLKEYEKAEESYLECLKICRKTGDRMTESNATTTLSSIYLRKGIYDKAWELAVLSVELKMQSKDVRGLAFALHAQGKVLILQERFSEAEPLFLKALTIHREQQEGPGEAMCLVKLGQIYKGCNRKADARKYFELAVERGLTINNSFIAIKGYRHLYKMAKEAGNFPESLSFLEEMVNLQEIAHKSETSAKIKNLRLSAKIDMLEQETRIQQEKNREIEAKNAELDTLIYRISHDIRGPIASLLGLHQVVNFEIKDEASKIYFDLYHTQISRLNNIVMDLTNLSRVRNAQLQLDRIYLKEAVTESLSSLEYLPNFASFNIQTNIGEDLNLLSDKSFVNSILQNLIENALKYGYSEDQASLEISAKRVPGDLLEIRVKDHGLGIPLDKHQQIFELFYRATTDTSIQGTGMGLYITQNAVKKLGGTINVKSEDTKGTSFIVLLPDLPSSTPGKIEMDTPAHLN